MPRGCSTDEDDLVFLGDLGSHVDSAALRRRYKAAFARAGLRQLRFYDLRHTFGTLPTQAMRRRSTSTAMFSADRSLLALCVLYGSGRSCIATSCSLTGSGPATISRWPRLIPCPRLISMSELPPLVHVTDVEVVGDHELRLTFEDGTVGDIAFEDNEWRGVFEPLRDPQEFAKVTVDREIGTVVWPNGLDMAPEPLYQEAKQRQLLR
jgi:hypothetical protein